VCVWYGLKSAPTHHNHSLTTGPIFGVQLKARKRGMALKTAATFEDTPRKMRDTAGEKLGLPDEAFTLSGN